MGEVGIIGLDLAKNLFQVHGSGAGGSVVFRRKQSRAQALTFLAGPSPRVVAMACASPGPGDRRSGDGDRMGRCRRVVAG